MSKILIYCFKLFAFTFVGIIAFELLFVLADAGTVSILYLSNHILHFLLDIGAEFLQSPPDLGAFASTLAALLMHLL